MTEPSVRAPHLMRWFYGIIVLVSVLGVGGLATAVRPPMEPLPEGEPFPVLQTASDWTSGIARPVTHAPDRPTVLVVIDSGCDFCNQQLTDVAAAGDPLDADMVFITPEKEPPPGYITEWHWLSSDTTTVWIRVTPAEIKRVLRVNSVPSTFIYDPSGRLHRSFRGLTGIDAIRREVASAAGRSPGQVAGGNEAELRC